MLCRPGTARGLTTLEMVAGILGEIHARTWGGCTAVVLPGERAVHLGRISILHTRWSVDSLTRLDQPP